MKILFLESKNAIERLVSKEALQDCEFEFTYYGEKKYAFRLSGLKKYDLIVNSNYSNALHIKMVYYAKKKGISTVLLQDGVYDWANSYVNNKIPLYDVVFHDLFLFFGTDRERKLLEGNTINSRKVLKYVPRYIPKYGKLMKDKKYDFLITTANSAYFNEQEFVALTQVIKRTIQELDNCGLTYKLRIFDRKLVEALSLKNEVFNDTDCCFEESVSDVRAMITSKSTVTIEALYLDLPVAEFVYRNTPILSSPAWCIHEAIDYATTFKSMLSGEISRMNYQRSYLQGHMSVSTEKDIEHLVSSIKISEILKRKIVVFIKKVIGK
ncbi:hypothetical protein ACOW85_001312 [Vibrio parahaemolyticus]